MVDRQSSQTVGTRIGHHAGVSPDGVMPDASLVPRSSTGVVLCAEPCGGRGACPIGVVAARREDEDSASFEIECPPDYRETPDLAHTSWTAVRRNFLRIPEQRSRAPRISVAASRTTVRRRIVGTSEPPTRPAP
jgi:hypothetical protein